MKKFKNKILISILIIISLINYLIPIVTAATCSIGNNINLKGYGSVENHVRNSESGDYAITTDLVRIL